MMGGGRSMVYLNPCRDNQDKLEAAMGECGHEIFDGEWSFEWEGKMVCPDCFKAAVERLLEQDPRQVAREMRLTVICVESR